MGPYIRDFYCPSARLAIEVDGLAHDNADVIRHDERRTRWLSERDIKTLRFSARDILRDETLVTLGGDVIRSAWCVICFCGDYWSRTTPYVTRWEP